MKKILSNICVLIIIIITLTLMIIKIQKIKVNDLNPLFKIELLKVSSNSMSPIFYKDDYIIIKNKKGYEVGDIITYKTENNYLITHRIIGKYKNEFITKGDSNNIQDKKTVEENSIIGKVIYTLKMREKEEYE